MRRRLQVGIFAIVCWGIYCASGAAANSEVIQQFEKGHINWSRGTFTSRGIGVPPTKSGEKRSQTLQKALNHARADALKNMLEIVLQTRVNSMRHVRSIASQSDMMMAKVESLINGAKATKRKYLADGTVNVTMQMDMHGGFAQFVLPAEIKQIEPIKTVTKKSERPDETPDTVSNEQHAATEIFTGLVVDARGIQFAPAMAPVIVDEKGREVFGPAFASREFAVQQSMSGYSKNMQAASRDKRIAGNPLTVKGLRTADNKTSTIVISNADATKIKSASEHLSFLKKCSVMIVVD